MKETFQTYKVHLVPFVELFSKIISFVNILLLIRILPIEQVGDYYYVIAIVLWASVLMDGGINSLIYNKALRRELDGINALYTGRLFLSLLVILAIVILFYAKNTDLLFSATLFSLITYFSSTSALIKMLARAFGYINVDLITILGEPIMRFIVLIMMYFYKDSINLSVILLFYLSAGFIAFIINKYMLGKYFDLHFISLRIVKIFHLITSVLKESKFYFLYYLMFIGLARIDALFIESHTSKSDLAIFSTSFQLYQVAQLFFFSIITSQFVKIKNNQKKAFKIFLILAFSMIFATHLLSSYIFKYLFKPDYIYGQYLIVVLIYAIIPSVINYYIIAKNNFRKNPKENFIIILIVFTLKLFTYYILDLSKTMYYSYGIIISEVILLAFFIFYHIIYKSNFVVNKSK